MKASISPSLSFVLGSPVLKLSIFSSDAEKVCSVLRNRSRNPQPSHLGQQCGPFQSQFGGCPARSAHDPASLLKGLQDQSAVGVFQAHRGLKTSGPVQDGDNRVCLPFL